MKKFLSVLLSVFVLCAFVGCNQTVPSPSLDQTKPWETASMYERSTYTLTRKNASDEIVAEGEVVMTVEQTSEDTAANEIILTATTEWRLTYRDTETAGASRGLTDTIVSSVSFRRTGLRPIRSTRTVALAPRPEETTNLSYIATADYTDRKATFTRYGEDLQEKSISANDLAFDNEQLYFVTRALDAIRTEGSASFLLVNVHDLFLTGTSAYTMRVSCAKERTAFTLGAFAAGFGLEAAENDRYKIDCIKASVGKSDAPTGPSQTLYFADKAFTVGENTTTKKVLVCMQTTEYNANAALAYTNSYMLSGYTTTK